MTSRGCTTNTLRGVIISEVSGIDSIYRVNLEIFRKPPRIISTTIASIWVYGVNFNIVHEIMKLQSDDSTVLTSIQDKTSKFSDATLNIFQQIFMRIGQHETKLSNETMGACFCHATSVTAAESKSILPFSKLDHNAPTKITGSVLISRNDHPLPLAKKQRIRESKTGLQKHLLQDERQDVNITSVSVKACCQKRIRKWYTKMHTHVN